MERTIELGSGNGVAVVGSNLIACTWKSGASSSGGVAAGGTGGAAGAESAEGVAADGGDGVENVAVAALLRQQAERRARARLRVPHGGDRRRGGRRRNSWVE